MDSNWVQHIIFLCLEKLLFWCTYAAGFVPLKVHSGTKHLKYGTMKNIFSCSRRTSPKPIHLPKGSNSTNALCCSSLSSFPLPHAFCFFILTHFFSVLAFTLPRCKLSVWQEEGNLFGPSVDNTEMLASFHSLSDKKKGRKKKTESSRWMAI